MDKERLRAILLMQDEIIEKLYNENCRLRDAVGLAKREVIVPQYEKWIQDLK